MPMRNGSRLIATAITRMVIHMKLAPVLGVQQNGQDRRLRHARQVTVLCHS
jgi:hypothetical protein